MTVLDLVIRGGTVYGAGGPPVRADVAVAGDEVVAVGAVDGVAAAEIDATGRAVAPGFVNVLSHSYFSVLHDPRSLSELMQGVTTQVFGMIATSKWSSASAAIVRLMPSTATEPLKTR